MASPAPKIRNPPSDLGHDLTQALASCATEADIVQVLYADLHPRFGYDTINLQVLEREGWYHSVPIDRGVLQDVRRRLLAESNFARNYEDPKITVIRAESEGVSYERGRGPGVSRQPQVLIWVPIMHRGQAIAAISYQTYARRKVPDLELTLLEQVHAQLGVVVSNAYLNEMTRNQAVSLGALNAIARALSSTLEEKEVAAALHTTIAPLLPLESLELIVPEPAAVGGVRALRIGREGKVRITRHSLRARRLQTAQEVLLTGKPILATQTSPGGGSAIWVPILEGEQVRAVLALHASQSEAYEESTVRFLEQVADQVSLALRNAWSFADSESQRRRMEVVNAVGRRLASSLDRWAIMRTLRDELARHLDFDLFSLATVTETESGPFAEGYVFDSGEEGTVPAVPLATAGPSREAYESGLPVLIRRSPWARRAELGSREGNRLLGEGALITVTRRGAARVATRSIVWVPVRHGERISALLSLQSYRSDAFDEWHVQLLQDVAAHVSLSLANADYFAALQTERRRLEALHVLELGVAGAADERQIAEAVFSALRTFIPTSHLVLSWIDNQARVTGYGSENKSDVVVLHPVPVVDTVFFKRMSESAATLVEPVPSDLRAPEPGRWWPTEDRRIPSQVVWVPVFQGGRVAGAISAQRYEDVAFNQSEVQLLESAAPVVGIALRTVRLHRANEMALTHSVRIQEVAALAGHALEGVVASIADQARTTFESSGAACWAFDDEGRVAAQASDGDIFASRVLNWSGRTSERSWRTAPRADLTGTQRNLAWRLIPLWYADRLVGAIGAVQAAGAAEESGLAPVDFGRHAAIAIENARLAAETRGRIHTLEAVAAFTDLDITRPEVTRDEMGRQIEKALAVAVGALWLVAGEDMVRHPASPSGLNRIAIADAPRFKPRAKLRSRAARSLAHQELVATPIMLDGQLAGMLTAEQMGSSPAETRRLMGVLAGQAAVVLSRVRLVDALDRQAGMLNAILSHSPVGVILEDQQGIVVYANPEIERIYGVPAQGLVGNSSQRLLDEARAVIESDPEAAPDAPLELRLANRDTVVELRRVPIPGSGQQPSGILTLHEDVTREREILEAKDLMLRAIGHEVRSPAAAMKSTIAGLLQWDLVMEAEQRHSLLEEAYDQSDRLLGLVENQLIIAKLEAHRFEPNPVPASIERATEQVMAVLRSRYGSRVDVIRFSFGPGLPSALCEPSHLDQVLTNLIGNALEYTEATSIEVSASESGGWLEVTVADNGSGLPKDRLEGLFEKTGPAGQNRAHGGLGLGLYFSRLMVEQSFGGHVWLERTGPEGTCFKFTVPAAPHRSRPAIGVRATASR